MTGAIDPYEDQFEKLHKEKVALDIDRDNFLSAQESLEYGLIDQVITRGT